MARIIVFQHHPIETPGRLGMTLRDHGFKLDIRHLYKSADEPAHAVPADLDNVQGVISMGGPQNVGDAHPWLREETDFIKAAHDARLPVIGICLGAQLIASALGGEVGPMDKPEVGFTKVNLEVPAQTDRIFAGIKWASQQFQTHSQEIKNLPAGAKLMASNEHCKVQAFTAGLRTVAFQYHFECDRPMIDKLSGQTQDWFDAAGVGHDALSAQCDEHYETYARLGDRQSVNLAAFTFTFQELLRA